MIPIMIVEDEFLVRLGLKSMIDWNSHGFTIVADASNGQEGFELYEKHRPYLIITDIRMAPVSGLEMMKKIRAIDPDVKFIIISAYNDFDYAQQAISCGVELYLCKSTFKNEDLVSVLPRLAASYNKKNPQSDTALKPSLQSFDAVFPDLSATDKILTVLAENGLGTGTHLWLAGRCDTSEHPASNLSLQCTILENLLNPKGIPCQFFVRKDALICLVKTGDREMLAQIAGEAHNTLLNYTLSPCYYGISTPFEDILKLSRALSEASCACNEFLFDKNTVCHLFSPENTTLNFGSLKLDTAIEELMSTVFSGRQEETLYTLQRIVFSCQNYRSLEYALLSVISSFIEYDSSNTLMPLLERALKKNDLTHIILFLKDWILTIPFLSMPVEDTASKYVDTVISYIKEHLEERLSIQSLSSMVHLSPNYLGKIFFQKTGTFVHQYITNCRMNKACDLLRQTNLPINAIGEMVGIANPHYFSKLFRDTMGMSPSKYRG